MSIGTTPIHMEDIELSNAIILLATYSLYGLPHDEFTDFVTTPYEDLATQRHLVAKLITEFHLTQLFSDGKLKTDPKDFGRYVLESAYLTIREKMQTSKLKEVICPSSQVSS